MKKLDFFLRAVKAGELRRTAWMISAFALAREELEAWRKDPYPYRIVQQPTGYAFVDPERENQLTQIEDAVPGEPLFTMADSVALVADDIENVTTAVKTRLGNVIVNWLCLCWPFGAKIPFITGKISPKQLEGIILPLLEDTPLDDQGMAVDMSGRVSKYIYVDEYLKFCDACFYLTGFTQLCVPSATEKTMTRDPRVPELKARLLEENKDRLHDPTVIAKIMAELVAVDREWLKGDPGADFYAVSQNKSYNVVRAKAFGMHGAETGFGEGVDVTLIKNSLSEGWDISAFPAMNDSLRAGSFNRGAMTAVGGESVKWLLRASANMTVAGEDCGSQLGMGFDVDGANHKALIGFWVVQGKASVEVTEENSMQFANKHVMIRSPMYCRYEKTDYCEHCVGRTLSTNKTALSAAVADYGNKFLYMFMSAVHGKALLLAHMDYRKSIT